MRVLKTSILNANTSSQTCMPFTDESFLSDCLLCCSPCYTSVIHYFSSLTSRILF